MKSNSVFCGSDTTAVALDAERCEIYSDMDGVYSADPSITAEARHLPELSCPVMQEMSMAGAKVLHSHAVFSNLPSRAAPVR